jgi:hypothetical protein
MPRYVIEYHRTEHRVMEVEAESESAARQCWIDAMYDSDYPVSQDGDFIDSVRDVNDCPAGGPHTPTNDSSHPDRMTDPYWHCDECGASLPTPEKEY